LRPRFPRSPKRPDCRTSISPCGSHSFAPRGTPIDLATRLNAAINTILLEPDIKTRLQDDGAEVRTLSIAQFTAFTQAEINKYQEIIKAADIKAE